MAKKGRPRKKISIEDIKKEITENRLTVQQIADKYKVSPDTIQRRMREASNAEATKKSSGVKPPQEQVEELPTSNSLRDKVHALVDEGYNVSHIARELNISRRTVGRYRDQAPSGAPADKPSSSQPSGFDETTDTGRTVFLKKTRISTLDELIAEFKIDTSIWHCKRFRANKWEVGSVPRATGKGMSWDRPYAFDTPAAEPMENERHNGGLLRVYPLYQVRADFERKVDVEAAKNEINKLREEAEQFSPQFPYIRPRIVSRDSGNVVELSVFDHHFGGLAWGEETGWEDWDLNLARASWDAAFADLFGKADPFRPEKALIVLGNDQLNADNRAGTTERGTQQNMDSRYHKTFEVSKEASKYAIDAALAEYGQVEVVLVPGNHDPLSTWHLGDTLSAWYRNCPQVVIENKPSFRKWWEYGVNMLMFTHGNAGKLDRYPGIMAAERPEMWGRTKWREAHTGDKHHRQLIEMPGASVRILPSLRPPCAWSSENQYVGSIRAAEAYIWNRFEGLIGTAVHSVLPQQRAA